MLILNINGPINSGKSTVSKILVQQLKSACFIEVDDLLSDRERHLLGLNREEGWRERIRRLQEIVRTEKRKKQYENIIFAYPMTGKLFNEWKNWEDKNTKIYQHYACAANGNLHRKARRKEFVRGGN